MRKKMMKSICAVIMLLCLSGCERARSKIAYTVYPVEYLISFISDGELPAVSVQAEDVVPQAAKLDEMYSDILYDSKVFFHIGSLEPYFSVNRENIQSTSVQVVDLAEINAGYPFCRYQLTDQKGKTTYRQVPYYEGDLFADVDVYEKEMNLWLDPISMLSMAKTISHYLSILYPQNESVYAENLQKLSEELINLDVGYQNLGDRILSGGEQMKFVTVSASFGIWQRTYGFEVYPLVLSRYGVLPNEEQLRKIEETIEAEEVRYIVRETNLSDEMELLYNRVRDDLNLEVISLSNISTLSEEQRVSGHDYLSLMYQNLNTLTLLVDGYGLEYENGSMSQLR